MYVTAAQVLAFVGIEGTPSDAETEWATACAAAVESAIVERLGGAEIADPSAALDELSVAARIAAGEAYKRKEATFGAPKEEESAPASMRW